MWLNPDFSSSDCGIMGFDDDMGKGRKYINTVG